MEAAYDFGMIGLGVMGSNLLLNMADHGFKVIGYDKNPDKTSTFEKSATPNTIVKGVNSLQEMVSALQKPRRLMMSHKKQFDSKKVEVKLLTTLLTNETPDLNYYSLLPHAYLPKTPPLATTDLNNDGQDDIYVGGIAGQEKYLLISQADGSFKKANIPVFNQFLDYQIPVKTTNH